MCSSSARGYPALRAPTRAVAARPGHAGEQLPRGDGHRAELERAGPQVLRQVVVVALEEPARDAELLREGVQLLEGGVRYEMAPAAERQAGVRVLAQRVDQTASRVYEPQSSSRRPEARATGRSIAARTASSVPARISSARARVIAV